ncbi:Phosphatidylinositol 4-phosphate 3-kinase C2 domain-containing subunit beta, partial [Bienertia sinuspersici]
PDSFEKGLKKVYDDNEIRELGELGLKWRIVDFYVVHSGDKSDIEIDTQLNQNAPHQNASSQSNQEGPPLSKKKIPLLSKVHPLSTDSDEELARGEGGEEVLDDDEDDVGEGTPNKDDDIDTSPGSDKEGLTTQETAARRGVLVSQATDFLVYKWPDLNWPAKEIIEKVRRAYRVIVKKNFAYKVKYYAHKKLHGSMKEHYLKSGRYIEALKKSSLATIVELVTNPKQEVFPPVFQRVQAKLEKEKEEAAKCTVFPSTSKAKVLEKAQVEEGAGEEAKVGIT